ncbi:hypothetical protein LINPERPRIM_LOCUS1857 [Linum perenne]
MHICVRNVTDMSMLLISWLRDTFDACCVPSAMDSLRGTSLELRRRLWFRS